MPPSSSPRPTLGARPTRRARRRTKLAVLAVSVLLAVLGAEAALRLLGWSTPGVYARGLGPMSLPVPPGEYRMVHFDYDIAWNLNSDGFRERAFAPKAQGERRVGLLGDSFLAGVGVEQHERFADRIRPHVTPDSARLWSFGDPDTGTAKACAILERSKERYALDEVVLVLFGGNELEDNESWARLTKPPEPALAIAPTKDFRSWLLAHSRLAAWFWIRVARGWFAGRLTPGTEMTLAGKQRQWPTTERALDRFLTLAGEVPVRIWYLPDHWEWSEAEWQRRVALGAESATRAFVRDSVRAWAERHRVPFVDTTPFFAGHTHAEVGFRVDGHWNARGHALVAEGLGKARALEFPARGR